MFYRRTGLPEESELVMCTVTSIQYSTVFVQIDDFERSGMIHISEIAAGRIRNIRDYVKEGKKIVCKVLRVNKERGHVDLSLRRVTESQRRNKVNDIKLQQKAESIISNIAKQKKIDEKKLYDDVSKQLLNDYPYLHNAFEDVIEGKLDLKKALGEDIGNQMKELVIQRFKPKSVEISGVLSLSTYEGDGVETIKSALSHFSGKKNVTAKYLGGGKYKVTVEAPDYKEAELVLGKVSDDAINFIEKHKGFGEFSRSK